MVRSRNAGLSREYRRNRRDAGIWLLNFVASLGQRLHARMPSYKIDSWLELGVQRAFDEGVKLYYVTLGVLSLQQKLHLSSPLLRNTWLAIKGWRSALPSKTRVLDWSVW